MPLTDGRAPKLVRIEDEWKQTETDLSSHYAKLETEPQWAKHKRWHALLDPAKPPIYSCVSLAPHQFDGPEVFRNELAQRCLFFCSCNEDVVGGKVVLGRFKLQHKGRDLMVFEKLSCENCGYKLLRPSLTETYWCSFCNERLCEMCAEMIAFEPM